MQYNEAAVLRFKAVAEADPGALVRVLQFFQSQNVVPRHVTARRMSAEYQEIEIEVEAADLASDAFRMVVAKVNQLPSVLAAVILDHSPRR